MTEPKRPYVIQDPINRLTIGIQIDTDNKVYMAVALCNPKDQYVRKVGFAKVTGILKSRDRECLGVYVGDDWKKDILPKIKSCLEYYRLVPARSWNDRFILRDKLLWAVELAPNMIPNPTTEVSA